MTCCDAVGLAHMDDTLPNPIDDLESTAVELGNGLFQSDFTIREMKCAACINSLEGGLAEIGGIERVRANLSLKRVSVIWRRKSIRAGEIKAHIEKLGFTAVPFDLAEVSNAEDADGKRLLIALGVAGFAAMNIMLLSVSVWSGTDPETTRLFNLISGLIATPAVFVAGRPFFSSAWAALRVRRLNMDVPISLAVLLAFAMSVYQSLTGDGETFFDAAVMLLFFLLIGRYLDHLMRCRARNAVEQISHLSPKGAQVIDCSGERHYRPLGDIHVGERIAVRRGERVPLDCLVLERSAYFDCSLVSGEATAALAKPGVEVVAGSINLSDLAELEVVRDERNSFISEIAHLTEAAGGHRSRYVRVADRMAAIYAPAVHLLAFLTGVVWIVLGAEWQEAIYAAIAVLIITCPCALGLAVPVVHVIAANRLFSKGIMMRDGSALERMAEINRVFFDKTGTLTTGDARSFQIEGDQSLLPLAKELASCSIHPISVIVAGILADSDGADLNAESVSEIDGFGLEATFDGMKVRFGRPDWVAELVSADVDSGSASVALGTNRGGWVTFNLSETIREDAADTISWLKNEGANPALLSGDQQARAQVLADRLGLDTVWADKRPQEKVGLIEKASKRGEKVLMVGDGLNDVAALCAGHVSMAPGNACDVGRNAADFVFLRDSLSAVRTTIETAKFSARLVRQNFGLALVYNCVAVPLAMLGYVSPLVAALAMSFSSIAVVGNSMRLAIGLPKWTSSVFVAGGAEPREQIA